MTNSEFGHCCKSCQLYWTCDTKWFRGEKDEEHTCCPKCNYFNECRKKEKVRVRRR